MTPDAQTVDEIMGRCLCGMQATTVIPMWRGMSLPVCASCEPEARALIDVAASPPLPAIHPVVETVEHAAYQEERTQIAAHILNGMISSAPMTAHTTVDKSRWARIAVEWADALLTAVRNNP